MIAQIGSALVTAITGDSTITSTLGVTGAHMDLAPDTASYPFVTLSFITGPDIYTFGTRAWTDGLWQIRAWDSRPSTKRVADVMERIDTVLTDQTLTVTGYRTLIVRRMETIPTLPEIDTKSGLHVRSAGARFQIGVAST